MLGTPTGSGGWLTHTHTHTPAPTLPDLAGFSGRCFLTFHAGNFGIFLVGDFGEHLFSPRSR